jgi:hypothetical protein
MTTAKDIFIDFLNLVFTLVIIGLSILYFIAGDNFENFKRTLESLVPFGILAIFFLINLKIWREKAKKKEREGNMDITIRLTFIDKLKSDLILFLVPATVLFIAFFVKKSVGLIDILEALTVFIIVFLWQKWLFSKER